MNILLTGASGFIGDALLRRLLLHGHSVTACCRHPERILLDSVNLTRLSIDFADADRCEDWLPHLEAIDVVINSVGIIAESGRQSFEQLHSRTPIALFEAAERIGVGKVIQLSALGADDQAVSAYHRSKKTADDALRSLSVPWIILQPSIVYGDGAPSTAFLHALAALPVHLLMDGGRQLLQPIHVDDVTEAILLCLNPATATRQTLALVGPTPISYADYLQGLRRRLGKPPAIKLSLPYRYLSLSCYFSACLGEALLSKDNLVMLNRGNTADPAAVSWLLGRPPAELAEQLLNKPASQQERWHANLYFFKPLLCWTIAIVWLWSGITSLWFYPHQLSYQLLAETGITGSAAPLLLYGLAAMDIAFGVATLARFRPAKVTLWQIYIVLGYSLAVAVKLPEFLFHPFGPLLKNLPFLVCLLLYKQLQGERQ